MELRKIDGMQEANVGCKK